VRNKKLYILEKKRRFSDVLRQKSLKLATKSTKVATLWRFIMLALPTVDLTSKKSRNENANEKNFHKIYQVKIK
jgi:hypothetical protein